MLRINNIKVNFKRDNYLEKASHLLNNEEIKEYKIIKKSIDARHKDNIMYVYTIDVKVKDEKKFINNKNIFLAPKEEYIFKVTGTKLLKNRPIVVGSGPAGLFVAYFLALNNYKPLIIERGAKVEERIEKVEEFFSTNKLDLNTNIQFGEGGAGTFSDGKLTTGIKDKNNRIKKVLELFVECGAPEEIMYLNKPHIGTDILRKVIINLRNKIISLGGEFRYNTKLTDIEIKDNSLESITVNDKEKIACNNIFLCIGHSARDTVRMLIDKKIDMEAKNFAVGLRVSHSQEKISRAMYGEDYKYLPPASYKLTYTTKDKRGVYSFCMCPGGYVVNASSEEKRLVVNGMSNYKRDTSTANSAIVVTVTPKDFGTGITSGMRFQEELEKKAYALGNGFIPTQRYIDFKKDRLSDLPSINTKGKYKLTNIRHLLPESLNKDFIEGMEHFSYKIKGFTDKDTVLYGVETRTSSPIRIKRDEEGLSNINGIYPTGEGAGYAGGIISSAVDGIKQAENFMKKYKNK
ncbi:MAG: FAD-dependent oxidoreductase [Bacilli bacterium]|nr:FAD-dependent oxidoreductase [Bacilli bacterium]